MVQTGDPTGTGKGGQSIWGEYFPVITTDKKNLILLLNRHLFFV